MEQKELQVRAIETYMKGFMDGYNDRAVDRDVIPELRACYERGLTAGAFEKKQIVGAAD